MCDVAGASMDDVLLGKASIIERCLGRIDEVYCGLLLKLALP